MTRPAVSSLVLDGSEVKLRLEAERTFSKVPVHVDWVRVTFIRRNVPAPSVDLLFPPASQAQSVWDADDRKAQLGRILATIPDADTDAAAQALELANVACETLGSEFSVVPEVRKGHDFYRHRWSIERNGFECGWVGFLASGDSPRQQAQGQTLHLNLFGAACTFAEHGWNNRLADMIDERDGTLTRCDLALDFFDGFTGGMQRVYDEYRAGAMNVNGRRIKSNMVGRWAEECERSFYFGSKEAGKQTNVYEKGDQLFGVDSGSAWIRIELRYGNKLRMLSSELLRRPADHFCGASDWHAAMLAEAGAVVAPEAVPTLGRLPLETVDAEVSRVLRWVRNTAAAAFGELVTHVDVDSILSMVMHKPAPGRLQKFSHAERAASFSRHFTVEGASPSFA